MQTIELFSGTGSFSAVAQRLGHSTFTVDNDPGHKPDLVADIANLRPGDVPNRPDIIWCSPPCQAFSVAAIGYHWNRDRTPKTPQAFQALLLVKASVRLITLLKPKWVFIENPRGMLRKLSLLDPFHRHTITYCQYGDTRMKPTDIWTNAPWWQPRPACRNGMACHQAAPRGSKTGTQGLKNARERGRIPANLFVELFAQLDACGANPAAHARRTTHQGDNDNVQTTAHANDNLPRAVTAHLGHDHGAGIALPSRTKQEV